MMQKMPKVYFSTGSILFFSDKSKVACRCDLKRGFCVRVVSSMIKLGCISTLRLLELLSAVP